MCNLPNWRFSVLLFRGSPWRSVCDNTAICERRGAQYPNLENLALLRKILLYRCLRVWVQDVVGLRHTQPIIEFANCTRGIDLNCEHLYVYGPEKATMMATTSLVVRTPGYATALVQGLNSFFNNPKRLSPSLISGHLYCTVKKW